VWNWAKCDAFKAARPFAGAGKWLTAYDLDSFRGRRASSNTSARHDSRVNAGLPRAGAVQEGTAWRVSRGRGARSVGCRSSDADQRKGRCLRFAGKTLRVFEAQRSRVWCGSALLRQDAVGDWWLSVAVDVAVSDRGCEIAVGIRLGQDDGRDQ